MSSPATCCLWPANFVSVLRAQKDQRNTGGCKGLAGVRVIVQVVVCASAAAIRWHQRAQSLEKHPERFQSARRSGSCRLRMSIPVSPSAGSGSGRRAVWSDSAASHRRAASPKRRRKAFRARSGRQADAARLGQGRTAAG